MAVVLNLIPPWGRWLAGVLLLAGAFVGGWMVNDWRRDSDLVEQLQAARAAERNLWKAAVQNANASLADAERRSAGTAVELEQFRQATRLLQEALAREPLIEYREVPVREGETTVRVPVRAARYRLCFNAAVTGAAADRAACEAAGLHGPDGAAVVPAAGVVRPGHP